MSQSEEASVSWLGAEEAADAQSDRRLGLLEPLVANLRGGRLRIVLPNGRAIVSPADRGGLQGTLVIERWRALRRLALGGDVGFAEAYVDGDWTSPDPVALLRIAAHNFEPLREATQGSALFRWADRLRHLARGNTRRSSRRNIMAHYDLGNDFYELWLDPTMQYSSALWTEDTPDLEAAQALKLNRVVELLDLSGGESVLEIGCGWGSLATRLAETEGAGVTAITPFARPTCLRPRPRDLSRLRSESRLPLAGLPRRQRALRSGRFDRDARSGRGGAMAALLPDRRQIAESGRPRRPADDHNRRSLLRTLSAQPGFHPEARLSRRLPAVEGGARGADRAGGIAGGRATKLRIVLRANARRMAYALPFTLAGGGRPRLRRSIPPSVGLLPRLLRGRLRGRDDRRHAPFDRPPPTGRRERRITERQMLTRRSVFWLVAALAAAPPVPAAAFE